jgi:hypothetical protein
VSMTQQVSSQEVLDGEFKFFVHKILYMNTKSNLIIYVENSHIILQYKFHCIK